MRLKGINNLSRVDVIIMMVLYLFYVVDVEFSMVPFGVLCKCA